MAAILSVTESTKKLSLVNATGDDSQSLQDFLLPDLQQFTREGVYSNTASKDFHLFYVGRDNVHEILKYVLSRCSVSLYLNMFGHDDDELNQILMGKVMDPAVTVLIARNKSQSCWASQAWEGLQGAKQHPVHLYRSRYDQPFSDRVDRRARNRAETGRRGQDEITSEMNAKNRPALGGGYLRPKPLGFAGGVTGRFVLPAGYTARKRSCPSPELAVSTPSMVRKARCSRRRSRLFMGGKA